MTGYYADSATSPTATELSAARNGRLSIAVPLFCCTLFCSSALLFLVEPIFAKMVLPLLGGTPAVWNTCMVSFQALLLAAYAYGHWSFRWLSTRQQAAVQMLLLLAVALALPVAIPSGWEPPAGKTPVFWLIALLAVGVGLPFFATAGIAPVLQKWFSATGHRSAKDPYFLYAASNLGSMTALLAYPTLVEPLLRLADQARFWSLGYLGLIALVGCCALFDCRPAVNRTTVVAEKIRLRRRLRWLALGAVPSSLLMGSTTFVTTDIAAVPLLWVVPLAIYLLSFIFVFASRPPLPHRLMVRLLPVSILGVALLMLGRVAQPVWFVLVLHMTALFICSMACHGELAGDRPSVGRLTDFYLTMSLGGLIGGLFNALIAPTLLNTAAEYPIALVAAAIVVRRTQKEADDEPVENVPDQAGLGRCSSATADPHATVPFAVFTDPKTRNDFRRVATRYLKDLMIPALVGVLAISMPLLLRLVTGVDAIGLRMAGLGTAVLLAVTTLRRPVRFSLSLAVLFSVIAFGPANGSLMSIHRSFFGIHRIVGTNGGRFNDLFHGTTVHGRQSADPTTGRPIDPTVALTYYHRTGPIGQLLGSRSATDGRDRIGIIGMGVGSLAAYAGPSTDMTYYEIDPEVLWAARDSGYFTFLSGAQKRGATIRVVMGDARLTLRQTTPGSLDVLVLDAFSGDAIPVHLLTREAFGLYLDKLAENGVLAVHISNMYLDLLPVCARLAGDAGCVGVYQSDLDITPAQQAAGKLASQWVVIARTVKSLDRQPGIDARWKSLPPESPATVWTDDFSNVLGVFRWR